MTDGFLVTSVYMRVYFVLFVFNTKLFFIFLPGLSWSFVFKEMRKKNQATQHSSGCIESHEARNKPEVIFSIQPAVPFHHTYRPIYKTVIKTKKNA